MLFSSARRGAVRIFAVALILILATSQVLAIEVFYKNEPLPCEVPPVIEKGRTMVPVRAVGEGLGSEVTWNPETKEIIIEKGATKITLTLNKTKVKMEQEGATMEKNLDVAPYVLNGRTMVPLAFISEAFGNKVEWHGFSKTVLIDSDAKTLKLETGISDYEARNLIWAALQGVPEYKKALTGGLYLKRYTPTSLQEESYRSLPELRELYGGNYVIFNLDKPTDAMYTYIMVNTKTREVFAEDPKGSYYQSTIYKFPEKTVAVPLNPAGDAELKGQLVVDVLKSQKKLSQDKYYETEVSVDWLKEGYKYWDRVIVYDNSQTPRKEMGTYYIDFLNDIMDAKKKTVYSNPLGKTKPYIRLNQQNVVPEVLKILDGLGLLTAGKDNYKVVDAVAHDSGDKPSSYGDILRGYFLRIQEQKPDGTTGPTKEYLIEGDGSRLVEFDPINRVYVTIYGNRCPVG